MSGKTIDGLMELVKRYGECEHAHRLEQAVDWLNDVQTYAEALAAPQEQPAQPTSDEPWGIRDAQPLTDWEISKDGEGYAINSPGGYYYAERSIENPAEDMLFELVRAIASPAIEPADVNAGDDRKLLGRVIAFLCGAGMKMELAQEAAPELVALVRNAGVALPAMDSYIVAQRGPNPGAGVLTPEDPAYGVMVDAKGGDDAQR